MTEIGPDLGDGQFKWRCGVLAKNRSIYCFPCKSDRILKIDTIDGIVPLLDIELPETGHWMWASGALALDDCIHFYA